MSERSQQAPLPEARCDVRLCAEHIAADARAGCLIKLLASASLILFLASALHPASASDASSWAGKPPQAGHRAAAIVNGHHVQPRRGSAPEPVTDEVQQLYRELMDLTAPDKLRDLDGMPLTLPGPSPSLAKVGRE